MRAGMLAFSLGILSAAILSASTVRSVEELLPWLPLSACLIILTLPSRFRFQGLMIILCYFLGLHRVVSCSNEYFSRLLPESLEAVSLNVSGTVLDVPRWQGDKARFLFHAEAAQGEQGEQWSGITLLNWYEAPALYPGDFLQLTVKLRRVHGFASPGAMDYEARMLREGVLATGYVVQGQVVGASESFRFALPRIRQHMGQWFIDIPQPAGGLLRALLTGDRQDISAEQWEVLGKTGTAHLVVISGLHIALLAALGYGFTALLFRLGLCPGFMPLPRLGALVGLVLAVGYALIAGMGLPVQRALIMLAVALSGKITGLEFRPSTLLLVAFCLVLAIDPLAFTCCGFWYSFVAVAALLLGLSGRPGFKSGWLYPQLLVFIALTSLLATNMQPVSLISPLINLVAIPLIGLVFVPLLLLWAFLQSVLPVDISSGLLLLAEILNIGFGWLEYCASDLCSGASLPMPGLTAMICALAGSLLLLLPAGSGLRWIAWIFFLPWLLPSLQRPEHGGVRLTQLDVGQGLALALQTRNHALLYDTGDRFSDSFTAADAVVLPYLASVRQRDLDMLIVSHGDRDHSGGVDAICNALKPVQILAGMPELLPQRIASRQCMPGQSWEWDGVSFRILSGKAEGIANDRSCVLLVETGSGNILLTGDITRRQERWLVNSYPDLKAKVITVPHHGSKTSSSDEFLDQLQPQLALVSAGYRNRFRHPATTVMDRMSERNICVMKSADLGSLEVSLENNQISVKSYRFAMDRLWWKAQGFTDKRCTPGQESRVPVKNNG